MTSRPQAGPYGLLETLSPEMAKDLGDAFSLARIVDRSNNPAPREGSDSARGPLHFAGRVAICLLVASVAVAVTVAAMVLIPLP